MYTFSTDHLITLAMDPAQDIDVVMDNEATDTTAPAAATAAIRKGRKKRDSATIITEQVNTIRRLQYSNRNLKEIIRGDKEDNVDESSSENESDEDNRDADEECNEEVDDPATQNTPMNAISAALSHALGK